MLRNGWHIQFLKEDAKTPLRKKLTFADPSKIIEMAKRGHANLNLESRAMLDHGIENGRGGFFMELTDEQYKRLL